MPTFLVVGLGNPGSVYAQTRHNAGFMVADTCCARLRGRWRQGAGDYLFAEASAGNSDLVLLKPVTFMNASGSAFAHALDWFGVSLDDVLVVLDDFSIPLGTLRMRPAGSSGGHNGLASLLVAAGSEEVPRLRCGIGGLTPPSKDQTIDFVLAPFDEAERPAVGAMISRASDAVTEFVTAGIDLAMTKYNT